jgi:hypothetical protein
MSKNENLRGMFVKKMSSLVYAVVSELGFLGWLHKLFLFFQVKLEFLLTNS